MTFMVHTQGFKIQFIEYKKDQPPFEDKNLFRAFTKSNYFYVIDIDHNGVIKQELPHKSLQFHHMQNPLPQPSANASSFSSFSQATDFKTHQGLCETPAHLLNSASGFVQLKLHHALNIKHKQNMKNCHISRSNQIKH